MCSVSVISDWGRANIINPPWEWGPNTAPAVPPQPAWTRDSFDEFKEILRRLDALDKKLGLAECQDPAKAEWMREVEERLRALEAVSKDTKA